MSITAIGSIALDSLVVPSGTFNDVLGGSASHFATSCFHFENDIHMVGVVGEDFPKEHLEYFKSKGFNLDGLEIAKGNTFRWKGEYKKDAMDEAITLDTQLNVFESFQPNLTETSQNPDFLFLGNIHPALQANVAKKVNAKLKILDTMNLWIDTAKDLLTETIGLIDVLIFNETEARTFTGEDFLINAGKKVLEMGPSVVVIKRGEDGALLVTNDGVFFVPGFPVEEVIDPTGAGDSFAGGFTGHLAQTNDLSFDNLKKAVVYGNIMGSFNVQGVSTEVLSKVTREDVDKRFNEFKAMVNF